jgi:hypothetical protein
MRPTTSTLALAAGALFAVTAGFDIPHHQPDPFAGPIDYVLEASFSLSLAAAGATAWMSLRSAASRVSQVGWSLLTLGYVLLTAVTAATAVNGGDVLGPAFGIALLSISVGCLTLFGADVAGRVAPRGAGVVLLVGLVAMMALGEGYGLLAWSAAWFAVAGLARLTSTDRDRDRELDRVPTAA